MKQKAVCVGSARGGEGLSVAPGVSGSFHLRKEIGPDTSLGAFRQPDQCPEFFPKISNSSSRKSPEL